MSSPQGGQDPVHRYSSRDGGDTTETPIDTSPTASQSVVHTEFETTSRDVIGTQSGGQETAGFEEATSSNPLLITDNQDAAHQLATDNGVMSREYLHRRYSVQDLYDDDTASAGPSSSHDHFARQAASDGELGAEGLYHTYNESQHSTVPAHTLPVASPHSRVPQAVVQSDATRGQAQGIPNQGNEWSSEERHMAHYSGFRDEPGQQSEHFGAELRVYSPRTSYPQPTVAEAPGNVTRRGSQGARGARWRSEGLRSPGFTFSRWQPDAEVTYCPICRTQFSFFVRKHHCRKCGRVVCATCSPHRIIIPHQYIVRPPGSDYSQPSTLLVDGIGAGYFESNALSGGQRVRLCNPCVPDPNTAPPQGQSPSIGPNSPTSHHRSRSSLAGTRATLHPSNRYAAAFAATDNDDSLRPNPRARSITMNPLSQPSSFDAAFEHYLSAPNINTQDSFQQFRHGRHNVSLRLSRNRHSSFDFESAASSSRQRALPPPPPIDEEDECPVCHFELPARNQPNFETLREHHINSCIHAHSTYGSPLPARAEEAVFVVPRRSGMYVYSATEKDCVDDAECTICLEEFTVGVPMARLECLCRFHKSCISAWFVGHPGRCPVHQHDVYGF